MTSVPQIILPNVSGQPSPNIGGLLVLSRIVGMTSPESIVIVDRDIEITPTEIKDGLVRLEIQAPQKYVIEGAQLENGKRVVRKRVGESFSIYDSIIKVVEIKGNRVRIGINAPKEVTILRSEIVSQQAALPEETVVRKTPSKISPEARHHYRTAMYLWGK